MSQRVPVLDGKLLAVLGLRRTLAVEPGVPARFTLVVLAALEREGVKYVYRMKKGTVRPKDWGDAQQIARRFGLKE